MYIHAVIFGFLFIYFILPESVRWLNSKGKITSVKKNLKTRAYVNNSALIIPEDLLKETTTQVTMTYTVLQMFRQFCLFMM